MKIAVPVDKNNLETNISSTYGRAAYYYIYNKEDKEGIFVENTAASGSGGVGIKAAQILINNGVDVLLTPRLGDNAADVLEKANIEFFKTEGENLEKNIQDYLDGNLEKLSEIHSGHHGD